MDDTLLKSHYTPMKLPLEMPLDYMHDNLKLKIPPSETKSRHKMCTKGFEPVVNGILSTSLTGLTVTPQDLWLIYTSTMKRSFSAMNIVKTRLRNKMEDDFLNDSLVLFIEREIVEKISLENIVQDFKAAKDQRVFICYNYGYYLLFSLLKKYKRISPTTIITQPECVPSQDFVKVVKFTQYKAIPDYRPDNFKFNFSYLTRPSLFHTLGIGLTRSHGNSLVSHDPKTT
ncbi:hypothetical protein OSB04_un001550 [Centaurea solstitialis]|uniref:Uncharacterized protein n=1 Tax=Centaurea solstitialis TaxID=347529 RepID=A0AA38W2I2_9ASTR|nr:hypothetical protein OSB04_un001550 [Centaurea solstitialis]